MIIDRIKAGKSVEAIGEWNRLDLEASLSPEDHPQDAYNQIKQVLDTLLPGRGETYSQPIYSNGTGGDSTAHLTNEDRKAQSIQSTIEAINTSTSIKGVEIFRKLVERENIPEITNAFNNKLQLLNNEHN